MQKWCVVKLAKRMALLCIGGALIFQAVHLWDGRGEGFRLYKIQSNPPYEERWNMAFSQEDLDQANMALHQKFRYLGHGFQCYAFVSEDDKYVLKFFRHQRLRLPDFVVAIPSLPFFAEWRKTKILALSRRKEYLLRSCKTSWNLARDETQLLMVHLNTTKSQFPEVTIIDPLGEKHSLFLDDYQFMLQRKALHVKPTIAELVHKGDIDGAKARIRQIFDLFVLCARKGIQDTDGALIRKNNLGFFGDSAIYIDGGKLQPRKSKITKKAFEKDLKRLYLLRKWIEAEHPQLLQCFDDSKKAAIAQVVDLEAECSK
jgi:hypothetical protein